MKRFYVFSNPGTPVAKALEMNSPFPDDFPPNTAVYLEDLRSYPSLEKGPRYMMTARNVLRVFNISGMKTAPYETIQSSVKELRALLKARSAVLKHREDKGQNEARFPDYPSRNAGHLVEVKPSFVDAPWGSGFFYVTRFVQGIGEWPDNETLVYLLQGLSKDGRYYVSADFRITHPALEHAKPANDSNEEADKLTEKLGALLAKERDDSFTPSLKKIRDWAATLKIE
ncbi:MAG TPA: hypothetical protein VJU77_15125 [Chthoniobacterales bacterium]|nr:hypothetical protein [Chthoniobacterales bacterium]